jgi:hypothetical protein
VRSAIVRFTFAATASFAACQAFDGDESGGPAAPADAGDDGGASGDGATGPDGAGDAGMFGCDDAGAFFCDDFDTPLLDAALVPPWSAFFRKNENVVGRLAASGAPSPPHVLRSGVITHAEEGADGQLVYGIGPMPSRLVLSTQIRVTQADNTDAGELNAIGEPRTPEFVLLGLRCDDSANVGYEIVVDRMEGLPTQLRVRTRPIGTNVSEAPALHVDSVGMWHAVVVTFERSPWRVTLDYGGQKIEDPRQLHLDTDLADCAIQIGMRTQVARSKGQAQYDDVTIRKE